MTLLPDMIGSLGNIHGYVPNEGTLVEVSLTASEQSNCAMVERLDFRIDDAGIGLVGVFIVCLMFHL